jgi:arsenate reductase-like glutaredoxin family protein
MNLEKSLKLKQTALRTIKIIELLEQDKTTAQILDELRDFRPLVERPLVEYYKKVTK